MSRKTGADVTISRMSKRAEDIARSVSVFPLLEHPAFAKNNDLLTRIPAILDGYLAIIDLAKFEAVVPDGTQFIDRSGYDYRQTDSGGTPNTTPHPFDHPFHALRDWQKAYPESKRPQLLVSAKMKALYLMAIAW